MSGRVSRQSSIPVALLGLATSDAVRAAEENCSESCWSGDLPVGLGLTVLLGVLMLNLRRLRGLKRNLWWRMLR